MNYFGKIAVAIYMLFHSAIRILDWHYFTYSKKDRWRTLEYNSLIRARILSR